MAGLIGCARQMAPPGGPEDTRAPEVLAVSPDSQRTAVPTDASIVIELSEKIDNKTLERALWVTPQGLEKPGIDISGTRVTIRPRRPFPDSTTVGVLLTTALKDRTRARRQNAMQAPVRWVFSTGDSLWPGVVEGTVEVKGRESQTGQILVALFSGAADTVPDINTTDPQAITQMLPSGAYRLDGLPADGARRWLVALVDRNENRVLDTTGEFMSALPETVILTSDHPTRTLPLALVDPEAPGSIRGILARAEGDSTPVWVEAFAADADSFATPRARVEIKGAGPFTLRQLPPGVYRLDAFCDLNRNRRRDQGEPATQHEHITLGPAEEHDVGEWAVPSCGPAPAPGPVDPESP